VLAREISSMPRLLVAAHPTRGLDVSATDLVQRLLVAAREAGLGVLLISEDLDELQLLSDEIAVLYRGRMMGRTTAARSDRDRIGSWMAGVADGTDSQPPGVT
jgi:simple sugar transport system ATP-binding protein